MLRRTTSAGQVPLANFGSVTFTKVAALASISGLGNQGGTISSPRQARRSGSSRNLRSATSVDSSSGRSATGAAGTPLGLSADGSLVQGQLGAERDGLRVTMRAAVLVARALGALAAPVAASAPVSPAAARRALVKRRSRASPPRWDALHPKYKASSPRRKFVACERRAAASRGRDDQERRRGRGRDTSSTDRTCRCSAASSTSTTSRSPMTSARGNEKQDRIGDVESYGWRTAAAGCRSSRRTRTRPTKPASALADTSEVSSPQDAQAQARWWSRRRCSSSAPLPASAVTGGFGVAKAPRRPAPGVDDRDRAEGRQKAICQHVETSSRGQLEGRADRRRAIGSKTVFPVACEQPPRSQLLGPRRCVTRRSPGCPADAA